MKPKSTLRHFLCIASSAVLTISYAHAASATWDGSTDQTWADGTNWSGDAAPGLTTGTTNTDVATFGTTGSGIITVDANRNISGINFNANSSAFTLSGGNLLLTNGGTIQTSGAGSNHTDTINSAIAIQGDGGSAAFTGGSSTAGRLLVISGGVTGVSTGLNITTLNLNGANTGANTVSGVIGNGTGGGKLALVKSGAGTWIVSNIANSFTGGISLGGGVIKWNENALTLNNNNVVFTANTQFEIFRNTNPASITSSITLNSGVTATFNAPSNAFAFSTSGVLAGGDNTVVTANGSSATGVILNFTNAANTFTGQFLNPAGTPTIGGFNVGSLVDSAGAGKISMGSGTFTLTGSAPVTLNNRVFELLGTTTGAGLSNNSASAANTLTVNTNLLITGVGAKTFTLGGSNTGANTWSTNIADGVGSVITVAKAGAGNWSITGDMSHTGGLSVGGTGTLNLSGTNTYSGATTIGNGNPNSTLVIQGLQALSANTTITMTSNSTPASNLKLLDDGAGVLTKTNTLTTSFGNTTNNNIIFVGNNSVANGGTSAGTTTGSTIALGTLRIGNNTSTQGFKEIQGANGYKLQFNNVELSAGGTLTSFEPIFNPTTAAVILAGTIQQLSGNGATTTTVGLKLDGTHSGNSVTGIIKDAADFGSNVNARRLNVSKANSSIWTLSGTNDYTGTTTISGGILRFTGNSSAATGAVSVTGGALGGTGGILGGVSSSVTVSSTGGINLADGSVGNLTLGGSLTITGAAGANRLTFDLGALAAGTDKIIAGGATSVTNAGAAVINLNQLGGSGTRLNAGTYTLIQGTTSMDVATDFALATTAAFGQTFALGVVGNDLQLTTTHQAGVVLANTTLSGSAPSWQDTTKFTGAAVPDYASNVIINSAIGTSPLNGSTNINSLTYGTLATTATTITAGTPTSSMLVIEAGAVNGNAAGNGINLTNASGTHRIDANIGLAASQTWTMASGSTLDMRGAISDFGANVTLTKAGLGALDLTNAAAANANWTGTLAITGGTVRTSSGASAQIGSGNLTLNGGVLYGLGSLSVTRNLGSGLGQIQITGGVSGFSEDGFGAATVNIGNNGLPIVWGSTHFNPSSLVLLTSGVQANGPSVIRNASINFQNALDLNGSSRSVQVNQIDNTILGLGATMSGSLSGTGGLAKDGVGRLTLTAANTYSGGTTINNGTLRFATLASMPATGAVTVNTGGTLGVRVGAGATEWTTGTSGNGTIGGLLGGLGGQSGSTVSYSGNVGVEFIMTGEQIYSGTIGNVGTTLSVATYGTNGLLVLSGPNTYSGGTFLNGGANGSTTKALGATLVISAANNLGNASGALTFRGGILGIDGTTLTSLSGLGRTVNFTNGMDVGFDIVNSANTFTVGQVVNQGIGEFFKFGQGALVLNQANTYTGATFVNGGILQLDKTGSGALATTTAISLGGGEFNVKGNAIGSTAQTLAGLTLNAGGNKISLDPNGGTGTTLTLGNAWTRNAGSSLLIDYSSASSGTRQVVTAGATTTYVLGNGIYGGILVKDSAGVVGFATRAAGATQAITRYDDTAGTTLIDNSNVATTNFTTLNTTYTAGTLNWSNGITTRSVNSLTIDTTNNGGTIDMGASTNVLTLTSLGLLFKGTNNSILQGGTVGASASEVIVHQTSATNTLTINSPISAAAGSLTKDGVGTLIIGGSNAYTGATRINDGTLELGVDDCLANTSNVAIGAGTLKAAANVNDTVGTLDPTAAATINLGSGATLAFAASNGVSWSGGTLNLTGNLDFSGTATSSLRFGTTNAGLTAAQLARISASGWTGFALNASGYLTATSSGGPGSLDNFLISAISSPQTVGTPITGITLTARDASNATITSFTGTVNFGGTGGFTGTSASFTAGVLSGVSVTPTTAGSGLTFTVTDIGSGKTGSATITTIQTQYAAWSGGAAFDADANGDGVENGLAWLLGAANKDDNAIDLLPEASENAGALILNFRCLKVAGRGGASLAVQYSNDLGITDTWNSAVVPDGDSTVNNVVFDTTDDGAFINVEATIPVGESSAGKLFGRLNTESAP